MRVRVLRAAAGSLRTGNQVVTLPAGIADRQRNVAEDHGQRGDRAAVGKRLDVVQQLLAPARADVPAQQNAVAGAGVERLAVTVAVPGP